MVDQAGGDVRFNADQSAPTLAISSTGEIVLVYSRSNTAGWELLARYSRDGVLWSAPETIPTPAGSTSFRVTSNDAGGVLVTSDAGGVPPSIAATIYVPGRGWSASTSLARGRNSGARIALHADGRAAVAHVNVFDPTTMCVHPGVVVHRYTPAAGWSPAESIDDLANGVADIGWSGDELIAAWHRPDQHAYAKALR
jgi:hypothetical protein